MNSVAPNRLGFFGPAGTFTHRAALLCANPDDDLLPFDPIDKVYDAVLDGHVDRAVAPIENSAEGYVPPSVAQLWRLRGKIFAVDHVSIPVTFSLYRKIGDLTQMTRLAGHPMALRQIAHWIEAKAVPTREASSSARGLEIAAKGEPGLYALGPPDVGEMFSLEEVETHLEGKTANRTRFLALAAAPAPLSGTRLCTCALIPFPNPKC
ncbi:hypothetical protein JCM17843_19280 [Kordiimonadales bacterium JCM 17843]|nr:hypothetical protein JCM17843_19280 [Kordiimonadales bacterium JCM 17843]